MVCRIVVVRYGGREEMSGTLSCPFSLQKGTQRGIWEYFEFSSEAQSEAYACCLSCNFHMGMDGCKWRIYQKLLDGNRNKNPDQGYGTKEIPNRPADKIHGGVGIVLSRYCLLGSRYHYCCF